MLSGQFSYIIISVLPQKFYQMLIRRLVKE